MGDKPFDVDAQVMGGVGVRAEAGGAHDVLNVVAGEEAKGTRVVGTEHADGIAGWNA
jgi:hypothetical protein